MATSDRHIPSAGAPRVLIVGDDALVAWDCAADLGEAGILTCGVVTREGADLDCIAADAGAPLLDIDMPGRIDGALLARRLRALGCAALVVTIAWRDGPRAVIRVRAAALDAHPHARAPRDDILCAVANALAALPGRPRAPGAPPRRQAARGYLH